MSFPILFFFAALFCIGVFGIVFLVWRKRFLIAQFSRERSVREYHEIFPFKYGVVRKIEHIFVLSWLYLFLLKILRLVKVFVLRFENMLDRYVHRVQKRALQSTTLREDRHGTEKEKMAPKLLQEHTQDDIYWDKVKGKNVREPHVQDEDERQ